MSNEPSADNECTRTVNVNRGQVRVAPNQHLHYFVRVEGATPTFTVTCMHKVHFRASDFGPPRQDYDFVWPASAADEEPNDDGDNYAFSVGFIAALKYSLRVELHDEDHNMVGAGLIVDADFESENPEASCNLGWVVRTKP